MPYSRTISIPSITPLVYCVTNSVHKLVTAAAAAAVTITVIRSVFTEPSTWISVVYVDYASGQFNSYSFILYCDFKRRETYSTVTLQCKFCVCEYLKYLQLLKLLY